jgi:hypothetical protein
MPFGSILSAITSNVGNWLPVAEMGMTGAGLAGNLMNQKARSDELNYLLNQQKNLQDPTKIASEVAAATQPLNRGLVQSVENTVNANLASQGLSEAPGIQAATEAQALAPFQQQNQQTALQIVMQRLGLPLSYAGTYLAGLPPNSNLAPLLALLRLNNPTPSNSLSEGGLAQFAANLGWNPSPTGEMAPWSPGNVSLPDTTGISA